jgi:histidyl-tRNA synthetase
MGRSVKAQMKYANKLNARFVVVIGDKEVESGKAELKDMSSGEVRMINIDTLQDRLKKFKQINS